MNRIMKKLGVLIQAFIMIAFILGISQNSWAEGGVKKININTASKTELTQMKGVGTVIAQRIVDYRKQNGPFKTANDLLNVKGVGPKIFEKNAAMITIGNTTQPKLVEKSKSKSAEMPTQK